MLNSSCKLSLLLFVTSLLSACMGGGTTPTRYYLVEPVDYASETVSAVRPLSIEILDLHIPQYLERFQIASRVGESRLEFSDGNQWGENLRKNLLRSMARNLSRLLSTIDVATPLNRSTSSPDYRVQIHIEQFELDVNNIVQLVARWQLSSSAQTESLGVFSAELQSEKSIEKDNYDQMVASMRQLYGELSARIADSIINQE
ncbi:MAG TPA: membrane integrity-associated transporter subunit PqiC [Thiotrichaceae bacterium]|nr:membrane integrity-associated transporter subunit PqiC [Thiotrichaceae bacterium]HIM07545.1 membrane integrity-associated transporter subunit PqiC [Gammaproteobacteria bacterium]